MHPYDHAKSSVRIWGGIPEDYLAIHKWFDETKETLGDFRHRALRHHSQGTFEAERLFGDTIQNSAGRTVPVRYIAEQHVREDCGGIIPSVGDWLLAIKPAGWMNRGYKIEPDRETVLNQEGSDDRR